MSYKERSIWASLAILIYIWFNYFSELNTLYLAGQLTIEAVNSSLVDVVILTIILEVALQILIAIIDHKDANYDEDERDKLITLHGSRNAYAVLIVGVFLAVFHTAVPSLSTYLFPSVPLPSGYKIMHLIIIFALAAEILKFATQIFYYRRGF